MLTFCHKHEHISPILRKLHWLLIEQRIQCKIRLLTFKFLNNCASSYPSDLLKAYKPTRILKSSGLNLLSKARFKRRTLHVPNLMQMSENNRFFSFALNSAHVKFDVLNGPKPSYNLNSYGKRAFSCATHELWNSLPQNIQSSASVSIFKSLLKTWFFKLAYPE